MKIRHFLALSIVVAVFSLIFTAASSQYEQYSTVSILTGGTNNVPATAMNVYTNSTNVTGYIAPTKSEYLPLMIGYKDVLGSVGTAPTVQFLFQRSLDGSTWELITNGLTISISGSTNALTPNVVVTNLTAGGIGYYRFYGVLNTNSSALTNLTITYGIKR